jgi:hypothetical protein
MEFDVGPRIATLLERRIVEFTRNTQHFDEHMLLRACRIEPHFMQPAQLTIAAQCSAMAAPRR